MTELLESMDIQDLLDLTETKETVVCLDSPERLELLDLMGSL